MTVSIFTVLILHHQYHIHTNNVYYIYNICTQTEEVLKEKNKIIILKMYIFFFFIKLHYIHFQTYLVNGTYSIVR